MTNRWMSRAGKLAICTEALIALLVAHLAVHSLRFGVIARRLRRFAAPPHDALSAVQLAKLKQVRWAVLVAARRSPIHIRCLAQALAAKAMLRRRGVSSSLFLGLRRRGIPASEQALGRKGAIVAHAWLSAGGTSVVGGSGETCSVIARYD